jgi:replicative superfamily II helicase
LNEERGAVIEAIVARTLRQVASFFVPSAKSLMQLGQVEFSQTMIRIVGLSATLPNYKDVAEFLKFVVICWLKRKTSSHH